MKRTEKVWLVLSSFVNMRDGKYERYPDTINPLKEACENGEWDIVAEAAKLADYDAPSEKFFRFLSVSFAQGFFRDYAEYGFERPPTKKEILDLMEQRNPDLFAEIPKSKRGLTNWWKEVESPIEQQREW